jgi:hypothetical protein
MLLLGARLPLRALVARIFRRRPRPAIVDFRRPASNATIRRANIATWNPPSTTSENVSAAGAGCGCCRDWPSSCSSAESPSCSGFGTRRQEERRTTLISDILWLEQNLRFHLIRNEEFWDASTLTQTGSAASFEAFARTVFGFESGLRQLIWLDRRSLQLAHPSPMDPSVVGETGESVPSGRASALARSLGKPVYSKAYPYSTNDWQFEVHVPVSREGRLVGVAVGVYRIRDLLSDSVPGGWRSATGSASSAIPARCSGCAQR